jgi:hypothetical protein
MLLFGSTVLSNDVAEAIVVGTPPSVTVSGRVNGDPSFPQKETLTLTGDDDGFTSVTDVFQPSPEAICDNVPTRTRPAATTRVKDFVAVEDPLSTTRTVKAAVVAVRGCH